MLVGSTECTAVLLCNTIPSVAEDSAHDHSTFAAPVLQTNTGMPVWHRQGRNFNLNNGGLKFIDPENSNPPGGEWGHLPL